MTFLTHDSDEFGLRLAFISATQSPARFANSLVTASATREATAVGMEMRAEPTARYTTRSPSIVPVY